MIVNILSHTKQAALPVEYHVKDSIPRPTKTDSSNAASRLTADKDG